MVLWGYNGIVDFHLDKLYHDLLWQHLWNDG